MHGILKERKKERERGSKGTTNSSTTTTTTQHTILEAMETAAAMVQYKITVLLLLALFLPYEVGVGSAQRKTGSGWAIWHI